MNTEEFNNNNISSAEENETASIQQKEYETAGVTTQSDLNYIYGGLEPKIYKEKKAVKKTGLVVGFTFLLRYGVILILNIGFLLCTQLIKAINPEMHNLLNDPAVRGLQQILFSAIAFTVPFILVPKVAGKRISDLISFKRAEKRDFLPFFLFGIAFCAFANIAVSMAGAIFQSFGIDYNVDFGENPKGVFGFLLSLISMVIMPALVEEFALRGVILGILRRFGDGFAVLCSAVLFGLMHSNFQQIPFAFLVGLVLGYITVKSGTIWIAVAVHAFNNFISLSIEYFLSPFSVFAVNIIYMFFLIICMLLGVLALVLNKKDTEIYKFAPAITESSEKQKIKWFFTSVPIIIYTVICFIESLAFFV